MAVPATPTNFAANTSNGQVYLGWDVMSGAISYTVQRSLDGITYTNVSTPVQPFYLDTTVSIGTRYWYQVSGHGTTGDSAFTTPVLLIPTATANESLGQIRLEAQQRADRVNSNFVTNAEWNRYIVQSYFELYDILVTAFEDYFVEPTFTIKTDGVSNQYTLPNGVLTDAKDSHIGKPFYKLMGVDLGLDASSQAWVTMKKFNFISRNRFVFPQVTTTYLGVFNLRYRLLGNTLLFIPTPSANQFIRLWYIARLTEPLQDTDMLDGVSGWTEYVIVDAAIKALQKEESDVTALMQQKAALIKRIEESAMNRDVGQPDTISDTRSRSESWGSFGPPNADGGYGGW